jgi:signal transduction histidine kinase
MHDEPGRTQGSLDDVLITRELFGRPARSPDFRGESEALQSLAPMLADDPDALLQRLLALARESCDADSAGVTLLEQGPDGTEQLRCVAASGALSKLVGGASPRARTACGVCLDRASPQLFVQPARVFADLNALAPPAIHEALILELQHAGEQLGTIWVVSHRPDRRFDPEDARILSSLASFSAAALRIQRLRLQSDSTADAKERLLVRITHDLRQPLNTILGWSDMLRSGCIEPEQLSAAYDAIDQNARSQDQLLAQLLELSKIRSGTLRVDLQPVDVCLIVKDLVTSLVPVSQRHQVTVKCDLDQPVRFAMTDELRLRQILSNLVLNAIKFTPQSGHVTITVRERDDRVEVVVQDTGVGIAPEFLQTMFEPFQQGMQAVPGREHGLGIGLTIVRELVEACGGTVRAHSDGIGRGTTMIVHLPICADQPAPVG